MKASISSSELVDLAYRLLKQDSYYDKMDLFLRASIAAYEASDSFQRRQKALTRVVEELRRGSPTARSERSLRMWLSDVSFRLLPKSVAFASPKNEPTSPTNTAPPFVSNVRTSKEYVLDEGGVQYFISAPVELYILSTLWCMIVGPELDRDLDRGCFGNRLDAAFDDDETSPSRLFKIYYPQYNAWRDKAVESAQALLDQGTSSVVISLDIKQYYYHLSVDWKRVPKSRRLGFQKLSKHLTVVLQDVHAHYRQAISEFLAETHGLGQRAPEGIPIGLPSSRVLANSLLASFDTDVREELQPAYYGRYIDDILIVVQSPPDRITRAGADAILASLLVGRGLLAISEDGGEYSLPSVPPLTIRSNKIVVHHFDRRHSRAGLNEFLKQLRREASDFRFLPADDKGRELDACAYDILYSGSINKLRSVIAVTENGTELSRYLGRRMVEHRLTAEALDKTVTEQLARFARGKNLLDFFTTWERILTLLIVKGREASAAAMLSRCLDTIARLQPSGHSDVAWIAKARNDLKDFLCLALAMPLALLKQGDREFRSKRLDRLIRSEFAAVREHAAVFRASNLLRHKWVAWPLVNYTGYRGSLASLDAEALRAMTDWSTDAATRFSPRYVHADEWQLFQLLRSMLGTDDIDRGSRALVYPSSNQDEWVAASTPMDPSVAVADGGRPRLMEFRVPGDSAEVLSIGIANLRVSSRDIAASYDPLAAPNTSWERQAELFRLLNLAEKEHCDMLVLPEVSVPYSWLPFMVAHAREAQIALVFGLEHWVIGKIAYNLLVTILPGKERDRYRACRVFVRPKNHYSPQELSELNRAGFAAPSDPPAYFIHDWRGTRFTVFNCYELSNIKHRAVLRANIDLLVAVEWNKDTNYFSNIVESTVRDLHCAMVQVNASQFGDSRVTLPQSSAKMNIARVSGGLNTTLLKAQVNVRDLNSFRSKTHSPTDKRYKPAPAGFEHNVIRNRGK